MARKIKPLIYVFWEGESEQTYSRYLKKIFEDVAIIKPYNVTGLFSAAITPLITIIDTETIRMPQMRYGFSLIQRLIKLTNGKQINIRESKGDSV